MKRLLLNDLVDIEQPIERKKKMERPRRTLESIPKAGGYLTSQELYDEYLAHFNYLPYPDLNKKRERYQQRDRALVAALYASGLRISELLSITKNQIRIDPLSLVFKQVSIEKQYKVIRIEENGKLVKKRKKKLKLWDKGLPRTGPLAPFTQIVQEYIESLPKSRDKRIFPLSRSRAYRIVFDTTGQWPHYFRSQYISYLANERGLNIANIMAITGHSSSDSLVDYVQAGYKEFEGRY